jgi:hypothetical protein
MAILCLSSSLLPSLAFDSVLKFQVMHLPFNRWVAQTCVVCLSANWEARTKVTVAGKPDASAAPKLARVACSRLP